MIWSTFLVLDAAATQTDWTGVPVVVFRYCEERHTQCSVRADWIPDEGWHAIYWTYRREFARRTHALATVDDLRFLHQHDCESSPRRNDCLVMWLETGHPGWAKLACDAGDVGSCLLEALKLPPKQAHARLADLCRRGAANACAWHAEVSRLTDAPLAGPFAMTQRACLELHEPVACAAAGKIAGTHGLMDQSAQWHQQACDWGYTPSCDAEQRNVRALADEAPPAVVGPSMLKPGTIEPMPGTPDLPGLERR